MLKKKMLSLAACIGMLAAALAPNASAICATKAPDDADGAWGAVLQEYDGAALADVVSWGGHTVTAARGKDGACMRLKQAGGGNWVFIGHGGYPANVFTAGTEYTVSFDYLPGPKGYGWDQSNYAKVSVGGADFLMMMDRPGDKTWKTYTTDITAQNGTSPMISMTQTNGDMYIDNFIVNEKETGKVAFEHNFDMLKTNQAGWWYNPGKYAETNDVQFYGWPANDHVGVIEHGDGYAAYFRNGGKESFWSNGTLTAATEALPAGEYQVMFDYIFCDANGYEMPGIADCITWNENWTYDASDAANGVWQTYSATFTKEEGQSKNVGWKLVGSPKSAKICVDNYRIVNSEGNVVLSENFDLVPAWNAPNEFSVGAIEITQADGKVKAAVDVTNSCVDTKKVTLITAIYNNGVLEQAIPVTTEIPGDPTKTNAVTNVSYEYDTAELSGKTISAFLWDGTDGMRPLANAATETIQ